jgi:hypothetical protein
METLWKKYKLNHKNSMKIKHLRKIEVVKKAPEKLAK